MAHPPIPQKRVWASLITNLDYLPGLLTLAHSLQKAGTKYPFVAFYTSTFPPEGLAALRARDIPTQCVPSIQPGQSKVYDHDPRFQETWTKLVVFSLVEYERVVLLDGDMLVRRNMDELMELALDGDSEAEEEEGRVFAASHACACNPMQKAHYPKSWIPANCAFTAQHSTPDQAQTHGAPASAGVGMLNSGLLVVRPSHKSYDEIKTALAKPELTDRYDFPDQELLSEVFRGRWVALPYVYNALKTLRWETVHSAIWRDETVKNVHYIFAKKPWHEDPGAEGMDETHGWWWEMNAQRQGEERDREITDGY